MEIVVLTLLITINKDSLNVIDKIKEYYEANEVVSKVLKYLRLRLKRLSRKGSRAELVDYKIDSLGFLRCKKRL